MFICETYSMYIQKKRFKKDVKKKFKNIALKNIKISDQERELKQTFIR